MGTQATAKSTPKSLTLHVHLKTGQSFGTERYDEDYGEYIPKNGTRIYDTQAKVYVDLDENGDIYGVVVQLSDSVKGFKYAAGGDDQDNKTNDAFDSSGCIVSRPEDF